MQFFSKISNGILTTTTNQLMRNFIANFVKNFGFCKGLNGNLVNELGKVSGCGVVPKFSDLEIVVLGITAEAFGFDSENFLFHRLHNECKPNPHRFDQNNTPEAEPHPRPSPCVFLRGGDISQNDFAW